MLANFRQKWLYNFDLKLFITNWVSSIVDRIILHNRCLPRLYGGKTFTKALVMCCILQP